MVSAISAAILSTLYGLLLAHFICHPLARAIERRGKAEEEARAALTDWLAHHIPADSTPAADDMSLITRDAA
jgi:chemotaxis protein MotA